MKKKRKKREEKLSLLSLIHHAQLIHLKKILSFYQHRLPWLHLFILHSERKILLTLDALFFLQYVSLTPSKQSHPPLS